MSTHCLIGCAYGDKVYFAFCKTDGYPEHMVPILRTYHTRDFLMKNIINLNGFTHLNEYGEPVGIYEDEPAHICSLEEYVNGSVGTYIDYRYLYQDCEWKCYGLDHRHYDRETWEQVEIELSQFLDMENPNSDGSYNFYKAPMTGERQFLVQRICHWDDESRENTIMTADELVHYIDMQDICTEEYKIYEITEYGTINEIFYRGWQPGCWIEFVDRKGEVVLCGYGTDH